jgi:hypothetical protein
MDIHGQGWPGSRRFPWPTVGRQGRRLNSEQPQLRKRHSQTGPRERLSLREVDFEQPPDANVSAREALLKPREANPASGCLHAKSVSLLPEPQVHLVHRDRDVGVAADDDHGYAALRSAEAGSADRGSAANGITLVA